MSYTFNIGDEVTFGRPNGEQTLGIVRRVNRKSISIEQTEQRGSRRVRDIGTMWRVHPSFVRPTGAAPDAPALKPVEYTRTSAFRVGDRVTWSHAGQTFVGTVKRVNTQTVSVNADGEPDSRWWRVPPSRLRPNS